MQVRATQRGFIYWVRHPGEVFEIAEHHFSADWMEKVESTDDAQKAADLDEAKRMASAGEPLINVPADAPPPDSPAARHWWQGKEPAPANPTTLDVK